MAMEVGVPIVPIVIHNAGDIAPKGDFTFRAGTVDIEVLPAVETHDWSLERLDHHVNDIRNQFLRALGQPELTLEQSLAAKQHTPDDMRPELKTPKRKPSDAKPTEQPAAKSRKRKTAPKAPAKQAAKVNAATKRTKAADKISSKKSAAVAKAATIKAPAKTKTKAPTKASGRKTTAAAKQEKAKTHSRNTKSPKSGQRPTSQATGTR